MNMDLSNIIRDVGFPIAMVAYLLWQERRFLDQAKKEHDLIRKQLDAVQQAGQSVVMHYSEAYRALAVRIMMVVEKNNALLQIIKEIHERNIQDADTSAIRKAFAPTPDITVDGE